MTRQEYRELEDLLRTFASKLVETINDALSLALVRDIKSVSDEEGVHLIHERQTVRMPRILPLLQRRNPSQETRESIRSLMQQAHDLNITTPETTDLVKKFMTGEIEPHPNQKE